MVTLGATSMVINSVIVVINTTVFTKIIAFPLVKTFISSPGNIYYTGFIKSYSVN